MAAPIKGRTQRILVAISAQVSGSFAPKPGPSRFRGMNIYYLYVEKALHFLSIWLNSHCSSAPSTQGRLRN